MAGVGVCMAGGACMVGVCVWQGGMHDKGGMCGGVWQGGMCDFKSNLSQLIFCDGERIRSRNEELQPADVLLEIEMGY